MSEYPLVKGNYAVDYRPNPGDPENWWEYDDVVVDIDYNNNLLIIQGEPPVEVVAVFPPGTWKCVEKLQDENPNLERDE